MLLEICPDMENDLWQVCSEKQLEKILHFFS